MLDAAPVQHGFQSVPLPRVDRQPVLHLHRQHAPGEPTLVVLRLPFRPRPWRPSRGASTSRSPASGYPGRARSGGSATASAIARRALSCQHPPERLDHAQPPAASLKSEPRHRRWSRSRSVLPPAAPSTLRRKARSYSRSYQRLAGTLHLASRCEAADPVHHKRGRHHRRRWQGRVARGLHHGPLRSLAVQVGLAPLLPLALRLRLPLQALLVPVAACLNVGTRERSRGPLPWATALAFSSALSRASASVTMGYRPTDPSPGCTACRGCVALTP